MCVMSQIGTAWDQQENELVLNAKVKETNKKQPTDIAIFICMVKTLLQSYMWSVWFPLDAAFLSVSVEIFLLPWLDCVFA